MTIAQKDNESFVNAIRSMTEKFIVLYESKSVSQDFSWIKFREDTLLSAIQHSFGDLNKEEREQYDHVFNNVMNLHGYVHKKVSMFDDDVEVWHTTPSLNVELHEYLGIAWGDYSHFMFGLPVYSKQ